MDMYFSLHKCKSIVKFDKVEADGTYRKESSTYFAKIFGDNTNFQKFSVNQVMERLLYTSFQPGVGGAIIELLLCWVVLCACVCVCVCVCVCGGGYGCV